MGSLRVALKLSAEEAEKRKAEDSGATPEVIGPKKKKKKREGVRQKKKGRRVVGGKNVLPKQRESAEMKRDREEAEAAYEAAVEALIARDCEQWEFDCSCGEKGANFDDGQDMIQCGDCMVWAHDGCVVKSLRGLPESLKLGALRELRYKCRNCAPKRYRSSRVDAPRTPALFEEDTTRVVTKDLPPGIRVRIRSDEKRFGDLRIVDEVCRRGCYERPKLCFEVVPGERWLDLGAHIGCFSSIALANGADVVAVEACPENCRLLKLNLEDHAERSGSSYELVNKAVTAADEIQYAALYTHPTGTAFRHSIHPSRRAKGWAASRVEAVSLRRLLNDETLSAFDGVKCDVQGLESAVVDSVKDWGAVQKLVLEYDFEYSPSLTAFHMFVRRLKAHFPVVHHSHLKADGPFVGFPNGVLVFALRGQAAAQLPAPVLAHAHDRWLKEDARFQRAIRRRVQHALFAALDTRFPRPHTLSLSSSSSSSSSSSEQEEDEEEVGLGGFEPQHQQECPPAAAPPPSSS